MDVADLVGHVSDFISCVPLSHTHVFHLISLIIHVTTSFYYNPLRVLHVFKVNWC